MSGADRCSGCRERETPKFALVYTMLMKDRAPLSVFFMERHSCKQWHVILSKPCRECCVEASLRLRNIDTFYPKLSLPHRTKPTRHIVSLFPNYLFVRIASGTEDWYVVKWCPGVKELLIFGGSPATIDEPFIEFLKLQADSDGVIAARCNVRVGQEVFIDSGPLRGLIGVIQEPPNTHDRIKVLLRLINRPVNIDVPVACIRTGWCIAA